MFRHDYPFDPAHGDDLDALLAVVPPEPPADFVAFWRDPQARARMVTVAPTLRELSSPPPRIRVFAVTFTSLDGVRIGGWLTRPRDEPVERGVVVGHGYGGRGVWNTTEFTTPPLLPQGRAHAPSPPVTLCARTAS